MSRRSQDSIASVSERQKVELPTAVEKDIVKSSFRNGILEAILKKITTANQTK